MEAGRSKKGDSGDPGKCCAFGGGQVVNLKAWKAEVVLAWIKQVALGGGSTEVSPIQ